MSTYDPRIVAQALDDLQEEIAHWSSIASDTLASAMDFQRHAKEAVDRALHNAAIMLNRARDDRENVQNAVSSVAAAVEKCASAKSIAHQTLTEAQRVLEITYTTLQQWQAELQIALAWLARAEARLAAAIKEFERARSALRSAEWSLSNAESRYNDCRNDKERSDCSGEAAAVSRARSEVASAEHWVRVAKQEVDAAQLEVNQAKARVACCEKAVALSKQAVSLAEEGESSAEEAVNSGERSLEFAQAAERLVRIAQNDVAAEVEATESMMTETQAAQSFTDEAAHHLRVADSAEDSALIYSTSVRKELEHRVQLLYELNRPSLSSDEQFVSSSENYSSQTQTAQTKSYSFTQEHRGITWNIDVKVKNDGRVDVFIKGPQNNYPHVHAFHPDAHGTNQIAVLSWAKKGEHTSFLEMPPALRMYILDLIANL
jgi:exonuclease VII small subunit